MSHDFHRPVPKHPYEVAADQAIAHLVTLDRDWGEVGDKPPTQEALMVGVELIKRLPTDARMWRLPLPRQNPSLLPLPHGGVALMWATAEAQVALEICSGGTLGKVVGVSTNGGEFSGPPEWLILAAQFIVATEIIK